MTASIGTFVDINGDLLWHFQGGDRYPPTVLLHGSFSSASSWGAQFGDFTDAGLRLFVPERSGHGHSPDYPRPYIACVDGRPGHRLPGERRALPREHRRLE